MFVAVLVVLQAGGTHQFTAETVDHSVTLANGGDEESGCSVRSEACQAEAGTDAGVDTHTNTQPELSIIVLGKQMQAAAAAMEFEKAAELRDRIKELRKTAGTNAQQQANRGRTSDPTPEKNIYETNYDEL